MLEGRGVNSIATCYVITSLTSVFTFYLGEGIGKKNTLYNNYMPVKMLAVMADPL